jgi:GT2 family glycosyltransferase
MKGSCVMSDARDRVAIIIVSWNTVDYLELCLTSLYRHYNHPTSEVIVVDNDSHDGSVEMVQKKFPQVRLICNQDNVGFAKACNQGILASSAPYVLLLNSDCELRDDCITPLVDVLRTHPHIGVSGSVLLHANGKIQKAGGDMLTLNKVFREQLLFRSAALFAQEIDDLDRQYGAVEYFDADFVSGAALCVSREVLQRIGLLREDFFMYGEDLEFCLRAQRLGFATVIVRKSLVVHHKCQSTNKNLQQALRHGIINNSVILGQLQGRAAAQRALIYYFIGGCFRMVLAAFRKGIRVTSWLQVLVQYPAIVRSVQSKLTLLQKE